MHKLICSCATYTTDVLHTSNCTRPKTPSRVAGHRRTGPMPNSRFQTDSAHDSLKRRSDEPCPRGLHHAHARVKPTARAQLHGCRRGPALVGGQGLLLLKPPGELLCKPRFR